MPELIHISTYSGDSWWYLISAQDGVLSRWQTFEKAKQEYKTITGKEWDEQGT